MKISIITPNYNYGQYISQTIESVLHQDYPKIEHIIVDDQSTDDSVDIIRQYTQRCPDKVFLYEQPHSGQTPAINKGLKMSTGDIVGWINSDDYYCNNVFSKIANIFAKNPEIDIVFGNVNIVDIDGNFVYKIRHLPFKYNKAVFFGFANLITSNAVFWRRTRMDAVGYLKDHLRCNMDGEYFSRLTLNAAIKQTSVTIANHRKNITQASIIDSDWQQTIKIELAEEFEQSFPNMNRKFLLKGIGVKYLKKYYTLESTIIRLARLYPLLQFIEKKTYSIRNAAKH